MKPKSFSLRWFSLISIFILLSSFPISNSAALAQAPQPPVPDNTGIIRSESSNQPAPPSASAESASGLSVLCFSTQSYDPCTRVQSLFSNVNVIHSESALPADLAGYNVVYIGYGEGALLDSHSAQFQSYVYGGGGLIVAQPNLVGKVNVYPPGFEMTVTDNAWPGYPSYPGPDEFTNAGATHPILRNLTPADLSGNFDTIPISTVGPAWTILARSVNHPIIALLVGNYGAGRLLFETGNIFAGSIDPGSDAYVRQMIEWAGSTNVSGPDMKVTAVEVTQAVQDLNNSVDLVAGKRTFVRVHVSSPRSVFNVSANLSAAKAGATLYPTLIPGNPGAKIIVKTSPDRGQINDSFWFELPSYWLGAGDLTLTVRLDPSNTKGDPNLSNNTATLRVNFKDTPTMRLKIFDVPYKVGSTTYHVANNHFDMLESWLRRAYPIANLQTERRVFTYVESGLPNVDLLNVRLAGARLLDLLFSGGNSHTVYYGMVDDGGGFMRGKAANIPGNTAAGPTGANNWGWDYDGSYGDWYGGHEIGHTRNQYHAEFCGATGGHPYPYPGGRISPELTGATALYGFDAKDKSIYPPSWFDVMTYCNNLWVSDLTYEGIRNYLASSGASQVQPQEDTTASDYIVISGLADLAKDSVVLDSVYLIHQTATLPLPVPGDWYIVLRDAVGNSLATYPFTPEELSDSTDPSSRPAVISALVPSVGGLNRVEIRHNGVTLAARTMSANAPTVAITAPKPFEGLGNGTYIVTWSGSDLDGDALTYTVLYSDDSVTWETVATGLKSQSLDLDVGKLPGGASSFIRVIASDGFRTGEAVTGPLTVAKHAPQVTIASPAAGSIFEPVQLVAFQGSAYDLEDGQLSGAALQWYSDINGLIGTGESVSTVDLSTGTHTITLQATDSDGMVTQATLKITVGISQGGATYNIFLPVVIR